MEVSVTCGSHEAEKGKHLCDWQIVGTLLVLDKWPDYPAGKTRKEAKRKEDERARNPHIIKESKTQGPVKRWEGVNEGTFAVQIIAIYNLYALSMLVNVGRYVIYPILSRCMRVFAIDI
ncbi:hypothetical protein Ancab_033121 [Ancistrocladus abbreviatus]